MEGSKNSENPEFLKEKYGLHTAPEVERAAERTEVHTGEKVPQAPAERIQNYLDRFTEILERPEPEKRERGIEAMKTVFHRKFVIKPEDVPESTFILEQRIAEELGHGKTEITDEFKEQKIAQIVSNQTRSMDAWIDYLTSPDAKYPDWAKYWAFRSMLDMGKLKKDEDADGQEKARFQPRKKDTVASFPPLNPRALAMTIGVLRSKLEEKSKPKAERRPVPNASVKLDDPAFQALLSTENFSKLYAQFLIEMPEYSTEGLKETRGKWVTYPRGSDAAPLVKSLEGHPLEWCIAEHDTAQNYLRGGDIHTYYSLNDSNEAIIPRVAIRMQEDKIAEVRGIAHDQNMDPYIGEVVAAKMKEFSDGAAYEKKAGDMKRLTTLEKKTALGQPLAQDDLVFLYELKSPIQGFGYQRDPRIAELRDKRNKEEDMPVVFGCKPEQIAHSVQDIKPDTMAYVGSLEPGIFDKLPDSIENIYTSFPEGKIERIHLTIGGKTVEEMETELVKEGFKINDWAKQILSKVKTSKQPQETEIIRLSVADLGFNKATRYDELCAKAKQLGLELCPAEVGPALRLQLKDQPLGDWFRVAMEPLSGSGGDPSLFILYRNEDGRWLNTNNGYPDSEWDPEVSFVFVRGKH